MGPIIVLSPHLLTGYFEEQVFFMLCDTGVNINGKRMHTSFAACCFGWVTNVYFCNSSGLKPHPIGDSLDSNRTALGVVENSTLTP